MGRMCSDLGDLADPNFLNEKLDLASRSHRDAFMMLKDMITVRQVEKTIANLIEAGTVKCPCHLSIGQEAAAVGVCSVLKNTDKVLGTHRSHAHYLAMGGSIEELLAEVMGKSTGCSKGLGGSMHLFAADKGFMGSVPIVGGTIPIAVGAAMAAKMDNRNDVAVCFFGDGASEEGIFHESLNLASILHLPILFVCENNLYSSHLDIQYRQPNNRIARFATAHHIISRVIDGNDVLTVQDNAQALIDSIRINQRPAFLETVTYRHLGHVGPKEDVDVGVRRSEVDLIAWKKRDPIRRLKEALLDSGSLSDLAYTEMAQQVETQIQNDLSLALDAPFPEQQALLLIERVRLGYTN